MAEPTNITKLHNELEQARVAHDVAAREARNASSRETTALNDLNAAQKKFDEAVMKIRREAPASSEWGRLASRDQQSAQMR